MSAVFYRNASKSYPTAVSSEGVTITDENGKTYLDMSGGAAVSSVGHQHPAVVEAICKQVQIMSFAHTSFFTNDPQERLAALLASKFGEEGARVYFTAGGSEANETAFKLAWQYFRALGQPNKRKIISRDHSYHGNTLGTLSASGNRARRRVMGDLLLEWPRIAPCYAYRHKAEDESLSDYAQRTANTLEEQILLEGADTVAAFIAEPIVGASLGVVPAEEGYFKRIREICDRYDVLLIADEIMCGSGRTGSFYAHEQDRFLPDIVTLAKGIAGGYMPLAATIARRHIHQTFTDKGRNFDHGHTYVGHAVTCAAGLAVLNVMDNENLLSRVQEMGVKLETALKKAFGQHSHVGDIRGRGLFLGLEIVADRASKVPFADELNITKKLMVATMKHGLIVYPGGGSEIDQLGSHILLAPPYIIDDHHIADLIEKLDLILADVLPK